MSIIMLDMSQVQQRNKVIQVLEYSRKRPRRRVFWRSQSTPGGLKEFANEINLKQY